MLETLTAKNFSDFLNTKFNIYFNPSLPSILVLIEVNEEGPAQVSTGRQTFSLIFRGSKECVWPQGTYKVEHNKLKEIQVFLVPIGPDDVGMCYEAVFN